LIDLVLNTVVILSSIMAAPTVVNVSIVELRKLGYKSIHEWLQNPNHLYIGRANKYLNLPASEWANPFPVAKYGRDNCIAMFGKMIRNDPERLAELPTLLGKEFGCWCSPEHCHGDELAEIVIEYCTKNSVDTVDRLSKK
jgi:hypothetical protein